MYMEITNTHFYKKQITAFVSLFFLLLIPSHLSAAAKQIQLNNDAWQAVGFQGLYELDASIVSWESNPTRPIYDIADEYTTYLAGVPSANDNFYARGNGEMSTEYVTDTAPFYGTVGIFAILGTQSRKESNYIVLDGSEDHAVHVKTEYVKDKVHHIPMFRMYIEGKDDIPTIRVDYQGDYEGTKLRVRFGEERVTYYTYFNSSKTYSNPADLYAQIVDDEAKSASIVEAVDFNISDNNLTLLEKNQFKTLNNDGTIGGDGIKTFKEENDDELLVYHFQDKGWQIFNSSNTNVGSNDFDEFEPTKGYWIKAHSQNAHNDGNKTKIGLITKDAKDLDRSNYYKDLDNGWNMLSFSDEYLRYATTGMFISQEEIDISGVNIFFGQHGREYPVDENRSRDINITIGQSNAKNLGDSVQLVNAFIRLRELLYGEPIHARAFPAMQKEGTGSEGMVIISNARFETNSKTATTLTGAKLNDSANAYQSSKYGEYLLGLEINRLDGSDINGSVDFFMPSSQNRRFHASGAVATDINQTSENNHIIAQKLDKALRDATIPIGENQPAATSRVYLVDFDFESNATIKDYTDPSHYRSLLITAGTRFIARDRAYTKVFKTLDEGEFTIKGESVQTAIYLKGGPSVVDLINQHTGSTNIVAKDLGDDFFAITSPSVRNLDLLEDSKVSIFADIATNDGNIPAENMRFTKGAIARVYTFSNLFTPSVTLDTDRFTGNKTRLPRVQMEYMSVDGDLSDDLGTYVTSAKGFPSATLDLKENSVWAIDFPMDGIIEQFASYGKEIVSIMTINFSADNLAYWSFIDLTKSPDTWYIEDGADVQDIFHLYNQKAYWVNIKDKRSSAVNNQVLTSQSVYQKRVYTHFNNTLSEGIGETKNHIDHTLSVRFDASFLSPRENPYYDAMAVIAGEEYRLRYNGNGFQLRLNSSIIHLNERNINEPNDPILLKIFDGLGNNLIESASNYTYDIEYFKPTLPELTWDEEGEIQAKIDDTAVMEYYNEYISDVEVQRNRSLISNTILSRNPHLGWDSIDDSPNGGVKKIRAVSRVRIGDNQNFYSNSLGFLYTPLKFGHVLSVKAKEGAPKVDLWPYSYIQEQVMTDVDAGGRFPAFNGLNGSNNGIQLTLLQPAIDAVEDVKMVYHPYMESGASEGSKKLQSFGGSYTMYLKITEQNSDTRAVVQVTYINEYAGRMFYIYYANNLYQGFFSDSDEYNSDIGAYNLSSGNYGIEYNDLGEEGNKIGLLSTSSVPPQPIIDPSEGDQVANLASVVDGENGVLLAPEPTLNSPTSSLSDISALGGIAPPF